MSTAPHLRHQPNAATIRWRLAEALANQRIDVHYQPIVDTTSRRVVCVEALARLTDGFGRWIGPDAFIPLAEREGHIDAVFNQVTEKALTQLLAWQRAGHTMCLGLNVSRLQLREPQFAAQFAKRLDALPLPRESVILEVTETLPAAPDSHELNSLRTLAGEGVRLALDDFGAGHAHLARINDFAWNVVKFDRSLIDAVNTQDHTRTLMTVLLDMAHDAGVETVGEGVEDPETAQRLTDMGITAMQGNHFCPALPAPECNAVLNAQSRGR